MPEFLETVLGGFALSATVWLGLGLWLSHTLKQTPAKAHGILVASLIGTLVTPLFFWLVSQANWGMLPARVDQAGVTSVNPQAVEQEKPVTVPVVASNPDQRMRLGNRPEPISPAEAFESVESGLTQSLPQVPAAPFSSKHWILCVWLSLTGILFLRLLLDFVLGYRLFRSSHLIPSQEGSQELETLSQRMGNRVIPQLATSKEVSSPVLWAWSRPARILIPQGIDGNKIPAGVYLHELAHLARKDHVWALMGELMLCLLPWHLLAWITRRQLSDRAEEACDDWVIACGCQPLDYADELVKLAPSRVGVLTMAAVSKRSRLKERVSRLVAGIIASPKLNHKWIYGLVFSVCLLAFALAVVQPQSLKAEILSNSSEEDGQDLAKTPKIQSGEDKPEQGTLPDQKILILHKGVPVQGAKVWIEKVVLEDSQVKRVPIKEPLVSDKDGLVHNFDYSTLEVGLNNGFAKSDKGLFGIASVYNPWFTKNRIELKSTKSIKGRIEYQGKPIPGVCCQLISFKSLNEEGNFEELQDVFDEYEFPKFMDTKVVQSNEKGEFSFEGIPDGFAGNVLLDKEGFGLAKAAIIGGQNPVIPLVPSGDLQITIQGGLDISHFAQTAWKLKDLREYDSVTAGLRQSFTRSSLKDSLSKGKLSKLGAGKYRLTYNNGGSVPYQFRFPSEVEIIPGKTTFVELIEDVAAEISGRVVNETTGKGVGGIEVSIDGKTIQDLYPSESLRCISKMDGTFSVYCKGDKRYNLRIYHRVIPGHKEVQFFQKDQDSRVGFWIQVKPGEKIKIPDEIMVPSLMYQSEVFDKKLEPVQGAFQLLVAKKMQNNSVLFSEKNVKLEPGKFQANLLDPSTPTSFLLRKGKAVNFPEDWQLPGKMQSKAFVISEDYGVSVNGFLLNGQGKPIPNRGIELHLGQVLIGQVQTREDGSFEFSGLWLDQKYQVSVSGIFDYKSNPGIDFQSPKSKKEKIKDVKIILK